MLGQVGPISDFRRRLLNQDVQSTHLNKRLNKVCKTFMRRFDPGPRLQSSQQLKGRLTEGAMCPCGDPLHFAPFLTSLRHCGLSLESGDLLLCVEPL